MMRREQRSHALVTSPGRQIDGLVDVREFGFGLAGGSVRLALHSPQAIIVREAQGERTVPLPSGRADYARWALPVAAFAVVSLLTRAPHVRRTHRRRSIKP